MDNVQSGMPRYPCDDEFFRKVQRFSRTNSHHARLQTDDPKHPRSDYDRLVHELHLQRHCRR